MQNEEKLENQILQFFFVSSVGVFIINGMRQNDKNKTDEPQQLPRMFCWNNFSS